MPGGLRAARAATMLLLFGVAAFAANTPDELTKAEARCQLTAARRILRYSADAARCYADCQLAAQGGMPRSCGSFGSFEPDPTTQRCLDEARTRADRRLQRRCKGAACPDCYFGAQCEDFTDAWLGNVDILTASNAAVLYCDDGGSVNGATPDELACRDDVADAGRRQARDLRKCFLRCHQRGPGTGETCDAADVDGPAFDEATQVCIDGARTRFFDTTCAACSDVPECWAPSLPFGCFSAGELLAFPTFLLSGELFCVDQPVCGDGIVSATEVCDRAATPSGCAPDAFCDGACTCQPVPDRCAAPTVVSPLGGPMTGSRTGPDTIEASCGGAGPERVFLWTPQTSGIATIGSCLGAFVTQVSVREAVCDDPAAEIACGVDACAASVSFPVVAGTPYFVIVDGPAPGTFFLRLTAPPSAPAVCSTASATLTLDFTAAPGQDVKLADAILDFPGPKLLHVPPATNIADPEGGHLTWTLADLAPIDGFDDRLDMSLLDLFGSVPSGDFVAADFECRPGGDAPTLGELSCTGRISTALPAVWTPVPCSVTAFTVTPPAGP